MGYASRLLTPVRIDLSGGYWAEVRGLRGEEADQIRDEVRGGFEAVRTATVTGDAAALYVDPRAYARGVLAACIATWNVDGDDGALLPITPETVRVLSANDQQALIAAVNARNALPTPLGTPTTTA